MKVLFICSGNNKKGIGDVVMNQANSLKNIGVDIEFYRILGKGLTGYIKNIFQLKKHIKKNKFDLFHAHFSYCAITATIAGCRPLIVSLMGSDVYATNKVFKTIIKLFNRLFWDSVIVKSEQMKKSLHLKNSNVIPNGVDLEKFSSKNSNIENRKRKRVIFIANPKRKQKNFELADAAIKLLSENVDFVVHNDVPNEEIPNILTNADVLLLTSFYEGSPNIIKEAMACNLPIVSTDVGDIRQNIENLEGCYVTTFDSKEIAEKISLALQFGLRTNGRDRIIELGLDSNSISKRIISLYQDIISQK